MLNKRVSNHLRSEIPVEPVRFVELQRVRALITFDVISVVGSSYNLYLALSNNLVVSAALQILFMVILAAANIVCAISRNYRLTLVPLIAAVSVMLLSIVRDAGGLTGFALFFVLPVFPLMYIIVGVRWGTVLIFLSGAGMIFRLLAGGFLPSSIYNDPDAVRKMIILIAYSTVTVFFVNFRIEALTSRLARLATTDLETGLCLRFRFELWLKERLTRHSPTGLEEGFSVVGFRILNYNRIYAMEGPSLCEKVMYEVGDRVRTWQNHVEVSSRWQSSLFLAALDTNEFLDIDSSCRELLHSLTRPIEIEGRTVMLLCSVAITRFPEDADSAENLIGNVLSTLDRNSTMPDELIFFDRTKHDAEWHRYRLFERLVKGDFSEGFLLHYQPKMRLSDGSCAGAEVLMRWNHPEYGSVSPAEFITLAEEIGSIRRLTRTMITRVFDDLTSPAYLAAAGKAKVMVALNLSIQDLKDQELLTFINRELRRTGVSTSQIEFEITEGSLIDDNPWIRINMENLLVLGFHLAIDDFGTGYSSLSYLHRLKVHNLKIDQSFVRDLEPGKEKAGKSPVIDAVISMGKSLGLEITAEGVETPYQAEYLAQRGCDLVQGWLYSKSLPFPEFVEYLRAHRRS